MSLLEEIRETRLSKIKILEEAGMDAYPAKVPRDMCLSDARQSFAEYSKKNKLLKFLTGRQ